MRKDKRGRRSFIKNMGLLTVGFSLTGTSCVGTTGESGVKVTIPEDDHINAWLQILENGEIKVLTGKHELGQGISMAIKQIAAEELNTDPQMVTVHLAETGVTPDEGYTAGSRSIESSAMAVRKAAACARELLLDRAAAKWELPVTQLSLADGVISAGGKNISFFELLNGKQIDEKAFEPKEVRGKTVRKWVGKPILRTDIEDIVRAKEVYVQDLRFPDMVHARILRPTTYTSKLNSLNAEALSADPGFLKLVKIGSFVGVIAKDEYLAIKLKNKAKQLAKWDPGETLPVDIPLKKYLKTIPAETETEEENGDWEAAVDRASITHKAAYYKPYIMHAANGPSCAVAIYKDDKLNIWSHTQGVYPLRKSIASMLNMAEENIHIKAVPGSGCYGHNGADDVAAEAALLAVNYPGRHIRLQWMRDDEHGWEPYGTAMIMELQAGLDASGKIIGWKYDFWSDGHSTRPGGDANSLLPARFLDQGHGVPGVGYKGGAVRNSFPYYTIQNVQTDSHIFQGPLRKSALRGLGAYANIYAIESFIDELAHKAEKDPLQFRLMHLDDVRAKEVITRLKKNTEDVDRGDDEGLGYAFSRYKNQASYCAVCAHVYVDRSNGQVKVKKMWAVIDSGECINPDGFKNQTEGGMIQSASWAIHEEVHFDKNHITSLDWYSYPIFRFPEAPETEVDVIDRVKEPPLGAGEAAQGPASAAVVNAIFNATGVRLRDLPVNKALLVKT
ncbi:molybdopterin cofactor-binding domain-containing protein [Leeuwenhoekiella sp. A16]|uniref:xanthine dehydrogenase family protein molybdopterin-binding subunit n=1 Tax=unclassified Leeuwenhoekiella TaxID=2615029 RepID=UPI003A80FED4